MTDGSSIGAEVGIVVGSRSDIAAAERAMAVLDELEVESEIRVISAHRAPDLLAAVHRAAPRSAGSGCSSRSPGWRRTCRASSPRRRRGR